MVVFLVLIAALYNLVNLRLAFLGRWRAKNAWSYWPLWMGAMAVWLLFAVGLYSVNVRHATAANAVCCCSWHFGFATTRSVEHSRADPAGWSQPGSPASSQ